MRLLFGVVAVLCLGLFQPTVGQDGRRNSDTPVAPASFRGLETFKIGLNLQKKEGKTFKRGAKPSPRAHIARAIKYQALKDVPPQYYVAQTYFNMWGNDVEGDCTGAESMEARTISSNQVLKPTYQEALDFATAAGISDGGVISDVLDFEASNGTVIGGQTYKSGPKQSVDFTNQTTLFSAIYQGPVKIGIDASCLPSGAGNQQGWIVTGAPVMSNYDHCMSLIGYGSMAYLAQQMNVTLPAGYDGTQPGVIGYTWATNGIIDLASVKNVLCEAWLRTPTTIGFAPPGPAPTPPGPTPNPPTPTPPGPAPAGGYTGSVTYTYSAGVLTGVTTSTGGQAIPALKAELESVGISPAIITDLIQLVSDVKNKKGAAAIIADLVKVLEDIAMPANAKTVSTKFEQPDAWWRREQMLAV